MNSSAIPQQCGTIGSTSKVIGPRVIGGKEADRHAWPWMVQIKITQRGDSNPSHYCGGVLIRLGWVLTAAHCTYREYSSGEVYV